jgi:hypothetical protein
MELLATPTLGLARLFKDTTTMNHHRRCQPWLLYPRWQGKRNVASRRFLSHSRNWWSCLVLMQVLWHQRASAFACAMENRGRWVCFGPRSACLDGKAGSKAYRSGSRRLLDEHENSNKESPRNREPGCIYTIEY